MNKRHIRFTRAFVFLFSLAIITVGVTRIRDNQLSQTVRAFGDLRVEFGIPHGRPLFDIVNMLPGDTTSRNVRVRNHGRTPQLAFVKGVKTDETQHFGNALFLTIREGSTDLYGGTSPTGPRTLTQFFSESGAPDGIPLSVIQPRQRMTFVFIVNFPPGPDDNQYQGARIVFDLTFGAVSPPAPAFTFNWDTQVTCAYIENRVNNLNAVGVQVTGSIWAKPDNGNQKLIAEVPLPYQYAPSGSWRGPIENIRNHYRAFRGVVWGTTWVHYQGVEVARRSFGPTALRCNR